MVAPLKKFKAGQEVLDELGALWALAERLEKKSAESLPENDPIMEQLGLACVHLMNAHDEIKGIVSKTNNRLNPKSVNQLLDLLVYIKTFGCRNWWDIVRAYRKAVAQTALSYFVTQETIRDLCTRRLNINTDKFLGVVDDWFFQNAGTLRQLIKNHAYPDQHQKIDAFFNEEGSLQ